ncbi:hypothetical protein AN478_06890 [Thiohalorhabdus denitrificans]|uniref:Uncharacterized protein n=1 Tax=Thiohalorhabdus denitrificans TaxID=381306 RepID=A0A0P9CC50_9GAMM|nr:hypothetical protein [Thiohalorhabdus denitrificans]KPV40503.1 hypothetical protein AN478_06890 [Thiohalorhabdus denitrificans]SCY62523.1 hypothetical protein SAMN05661077_2741 [Thiohalorhabdus denitrificans]
MSLQLESFDIPAIGGVVKIDDKRLAWVDVELHFENPELDTHPNVHFRVNVPYGNDWTVDQIHEAALEKVRELTAMTEKQLEEKSLEELRQYSLEF